VNDRNVPSDDEVRRRLNAFMQAEIAAEEEAADEDTIRAELARFTTAPRRADMDRQYESDNDADVIDPDVIDPRAIRVSAGTRPTIGAQQLARFLARQADHYASTRASGSVVTRSRPRSNFWNELDEAQRRALRKVARSRSYESGESLCHQGDPSDHVIVIESGWAKVTSTAGDGHEVVFAVRGPGDLVGESAGLAQRQRSATVTALTSVRALLVPVGRFTAFLDRHPHVWRMVSGSFVRRIDDADRRLRAKSTANAAHRLAILLLYLADHYGNPGPAGSVAVRPPLSQQELASWVDSSRETVALTLKAWRTRGLIDIFGRKITVLRPSVLRTYADSEQDGDDPPDANRPRDTVTDDPGGFADHGHRHHLGRRRSQHCVVFAVDIAGFTDAARDDEVQLAVRRALYRLLIEAFDDALLPWDECLHEDRGDGVLVIIPAQMPSAMVVDPLVNRIRAGLRRHNRLSSTAAQIRLRIAVHIGEVHGDAHGLAGDAVNHLFRLLNATPLKDALAGSRAEAALIVSDYFFDSVVRHGPGLIDPAAFRPVTVALKRTRARGWIHLPDVPKAFSPDDAIDTTGPSGDQRELDEHGRRPAGQGEAAPAQGMVFLGPTTIYGDAIAGNKIVYSQEPEEHPDH
jgi:CRP-like cAMP-binding protein